MGILQPQIIIITNRCYYLQSLFLDVISVEIVDTKLFLHAQEWCVRNSTCFLLKGVWVEGRVPEGCHHKAVVQCQGQRAGPEQARGDLQATNISE